MILAGLTAGLVAAAAGALWLSRAPADPPPKAGAVLPGGAVVVYSPGYRVSFFGLERLHPFDTFRYDRVAEALVDRGLVPPGGFEVPAPIPDAALRAAHDPAYLDGLSDPHTLSRALEVAVPGFMSVDTLDARVLAPMRLAAGGTLAAARAALAHGLGVNLGGGFHHARPAAGGGFCVYNDVAAALGVLRAEGFGGRVLIVDTDAHQGDGDHLFFRDDSTVFSFSMHQGDIFPGDKPRGDKDVSLPGGADDAAFLAALEGALGEILAGFTPELVIHVAGADVLRDDPLAGLALTPEGLAARDRAVAEAAVATPLVYLTAGGYGPSAARAQAASVAAMLAARARRYSRP